MNQPNNKEYFRKPLFIIESIKKSIKEGLGIVPIIGSGMSAASGIPAGKDYHAYLFYCLARVFGTDGTLEKEKDKEQWDPSTLRWPDYTEVPVYNNIQETRYNWANALEQEIQDSARKEQEIPDNTRKEDNDVKWQAIGSISDWRVILNLLSRLSLKPKSHDKEKRKVFIKFPDHRIIDSFFVNLTKGKRPNSSHMLLAHMSDILRIKIILTTNFDNLIESAFQSLIAPVAVFDVHMDASLPESDFVRAQRSVVKMHGGRYGLRADFSLDNYPTMSDVEKFMGYLSYYSHKDYIPKLKNQRNILVMGAAPNSTRIITLICRAMIKMRKLEVYWICYGKNERTCIFNEFVSIINDLYKSGELKNPQLGDLDEGGKLSDLKIKKFITKNLKITTVSDLSLFLLELYQSIFLSLPPAGVQFPAIWPLPQKPCIKKINDFENRVNNLISIINNLNSGNKLIYISGVNGVSSMASEVFYTISNYQNCIWLNLEDKFSLIDFTFTIIEAVVRKTGLHDVTPAYVQYNCEKVSQNIINQFNKVLNYSKKRFVIFINGRELNQTSELDFKDNPDLVKIKSLLLKSLVSKHVTYILLGWPKSSYSENSEIITIDKPIARRLNVKNLLNDKRIKDLSIQSYHRFMLSLTLVQHISYSSLLHTWPFIKAPHSLSIGKNKDNDELRYHMASFYLKILRDKSAIRDDEGHFVFMPLFIRKKISKLIEQNNCFSDINLIKCEGHQGIADWHMKLYRASGDIHAMADSIYHRLQCFILALAVNDINEQKRFLDTSLIEMSLAINLTYNTIFSSFQALTLMHSFEDIEIKIGELIQQDSRLKMIKGNEWYLLKMNEICKELKEIRFEFLNYAGEFQIQINENIEKSQIPSVNIWKELKIDENNNQNLYSCAKQYIKNRNYEHAEKSFQDIFTEMKWPIDDLQRNEDTEELRKIVREWIESLIIKIKSSEAIKKINHPGYAQEFALCLAQDIFKFMIRAFRHYQMLNLYYAQIYRYLKRDYSHYLITAEKVYIHSTEMMRYVTDNDFLNRENAFLRTNTGIMLSWMERHHEAYRRYNEAYGYLNFGIRPDTPLEFAIIDLRRGETFLSQIEQKLYKDIDIKNINIILKREELPPYLKSHFGMLYDAIASVDRGEFRMKGATVNTWWNCWMLELQLILCNKIVELRNEICNVLHYKKGDKYDFFGHCRECEYCGIRFINNLEKGLNIVGKDVLRIARYLSHLKDFEANMSFNKDLIERFKNARKFGIQLLNELHTNESINALVKSYTKDYLI